MSHPLTKLLEVHREEIILSWERCVLNDPAVPVANRLPKPLLRNHLPELLEELRKRLDDGHSAESETTIGRELGRKVLPKDHAFTRFSQGYSLPEVLRELSHLRSTLIQFWYDNTNHEWQGLVLLNVALDECMAVNAAEMEEMGVAKLRADSELRERFIGFLGHDLREPLNTVQMAAGLLLIQTPNEGQTSYLRRIILSTNRMARMIADLLDFTHARSGQIPVEPKDGDIHEICRDVVDQFLLNYPGRRIDFRCDGDDHYGRWDADRLAQVLSNLIRNAITYGPETSPITVEAHSSNGVVKISVHNQGNPIPPEELPNLFKAFYRGAAADDALKPGLGLGLFISNEIIRTHGGTLHASSDVKGTTFEITLPYVPALRGKPSRPV